MGCRWPALRPDAAILRPFAENLPPWVLLIYSSDWLLGRPHAAFHPAEPHPLLSRQAPCGPRRLERRRVAEPHGRSGSAAPIRRDSDGLWYALFAMQARENARLVSEQPQNSIFNFSFWSK